MGLDDITARVRKAEDAAGRAPGSVELIAISKVQPLDRVEEVLKAGHRVAICEQVEDPKLSKGIVKREVVEVLVGSPGAAAHSLQ